MISFFSLFVPDLCFPQSVYDGKPLISEIIHPNYFLGYSQFVRIYMAAYYYFVYK